MRSPGAHRWRGEHRERFWAAIAEGLSSEQAAIRSGVSPAVGSRWFPESGGMPTVGARPLSKRYLSFAEREEIALLRAQEVGVREIARRLGRAASTISRELRRNAATRGGQLDYRASTAQWHADRRARRPKTAKLAADERLRQYVADRLAGKITHPDGRGARPDRALEGPPARPPRRPALGDRLEPGADRPPPADGLPR